MDELGDGETWTADPDLVGRVDASLANWRQGDIVHGLRFAYLGSPDRPLTPETAESDGDGVVPLQAAFDDMVVVTQTCDLVRSCQDNNGGPGRPYVQLAPIVRLQGETQSAAHAGRIPRYAPVPGAGADAFADMDRVTTVEKTVIAGHEPERGCRTEAEERSLAHALGRHRSRFAFPDEFNRAMQPLTKRFNIRARKNSAEGRRVDEVVQIRVAAVPYWGHPDGYDVEIDFIVAASALEDLDEDEAVDPDTVQFAAAATSAEGIAERIEHLSPDASPGTRSFLWLALARAWAALIECNAEVLSIVSSTDSETTYPLGRMRVTDEIDLDYLSPGNT